MAVYKCKLADYSKVAVYKCKAVDYSKVAVYTCKVLNCLPKGRHSEGPHEIHPISSQNCSRVGCVMQGWGGSCRGGVGHVGVEVGRVGCVMWGGGVGHTGVG